MLPNKSEATQLLQDFGLDIRNLEVDKGSFTRCSYTHKGKRNIDGFYLAHSIPGTDLIAGVYGSFYPYHNVVKFEVPSNGRTQTISKSERFRIDKAIEKSVKIIENVEPDIKAYLLAEDTTEHDYLKKKSIDDFEFVNGLKHSGDELLIPYYSFKSEDEPVGVQRILKNGKKFMLKGSKMRGAFHKFEGNNIIAICEGFATGWTIRKATGWTVYCCFSASNMINVVRDLVSKELIVCADNDLKTLEKTGKNPGIDYAKVIAKKLFCPMVHPKGEGDFNDVGVKETAVLLLTKEPKTIVSQCETHFSKGGASDVESFLMTRKSLFASYDSVDYSYLKNRLKETYQITKGFMDDIIKGVKSEKELENMEDAIEKLKEVRFDGNSYWKLNGNQFYKTTSQEITLLTNIASDEDSIKKQDMLNSIHKDCLVGQIEAEPIPFDKSYIEEYLSEEGKIIIKKFVSIHEVLETRVAELNNVLIDDSFISYIKKDYSEIIDIMEASLARKFCEHKKAFVYLNCNTAYGKNFFFELKSLCRYFTRSYKIEDFRGNSPDDFIKPIFFFVDEADKFPSHYKVNNPEYKMLYSGLTSVNLGMRVLACANEMEDIERGLDPQLKERIVMIKPDKKRFDHKGIERKLSQRMWEKFIINHLLNKLQEWNIDGKFFEQCENHFERFIAKYKTENLMTLDDVLVENLEELLNTILNNHNIEEMRSGGFEFHRYIFSTTVKNEFVITSPKKFLREMFRCFDESRLDAFAKKFNKLEDISSMDIFEYKVVKTDNKLTKKGIVFSMKYHDDGIKVTRNVSKLLEITK